jgi:predicted Rossmann-fold nucleotide-binding protein
MEGRSLVYGGGSNGMMGTVSGAVLKHGGTVTAVTPTAILMAGGEGERISVGGIELGEKGHERVSRWTQT